jgi:hypothetical protein
MAGMLMHGAWLHHRSSRPSAKAIIQGVAVCIIKVSLSASPRCALHSSKGLSYQSKEPCWLAPPCRDLAAFVTKGL